MSAPPLRFLALVVGGWVCIRAAMLAPGWWKPAEPAGRPPGAPTPTAIAAPPPLAPAAAMHARRPPIPRPPPLVRERQRARPAFAAALPAMHFALKPGRALPGPPSAGLVPAGPPSPARPAGAGRWSGSAWLLLRRDRGVAALAPGGTLGGSQAGARILYRYRRNVALSGRLYAPLQRLSGAEAAFGLDWQPSSAAAIHVLAERRQALGDEGRSAFALTLYGGGSRRLPGGLSAEGYAQAGIVGLDRRDPFVDVALRIGAPLGPVEVGGSAWGAAQPGAARLDAGPHVAVRLPVAGASLRLQADWRFRVAGDAMPGSGPALTLAADF